MDLLVYRFWGIYAILAGTQLHSHIVLVPLGRFLKANLKAFSFRNCLGGAAACFFSDKVPSAVLK
jgi:hypothetical protein